MNETLKNKVLEWAMPIGYLAFLLSPAIVAAYLDHLVFLSHQQAAQPLAYAASRISLRVNRRLDKISFLPSNAFQGTKI